MVVSTSTFSSIVAEAADMGVSPAHPFGVRQLWRSGVFLTLRRPGVITSCKRRPALDIHTLSFESKASKYSCWVSVSSNPGKKSRAMILDSPAVYVSSSTAVFGRFIRFGGGGGGIKAVSDLFRTRDIEDPSWAAMAVEYSGAV